MTTNARLAQALDLPCRCQNPKSHGRPVGKDVTASASYTPELARIVSGILCQELSHTGVLEECQGRSQLPEWFGLGTRCTCSELGSKGEDLECGGFSREVLQGEGVGSVQGDPSLQATPQQVSQVGVQVGPQDPEAAHAAEHRSHDGSTAGVLRVETLAKELLEKGDFRWESLEELANLFFQLPKGQSRRMLRGSEGQSRVFRAVCIWKSTWSDGAHRPDSLGHQVQKSGLVAAGGFGSGVDLFCVE